MLAVLFSTEKAQTMQATADSLASLKLLLIIFFVAFLIIGLANLLVFLVSKHSPDLGFKFLIPQIFFKKKNIFFNIENDLGRPLTFTKLTIFKDEKIFKEYYFNSGSYSIYLPNGNYQATIYKFGHSPNSTDKFLVTDKNLAFDLRLKRTQEIKPAPHIFKFMRVVMIVNIIFAIIGLISLSINFDSLVLSLQIIIIALSVFSLFLAYTYYEISKAIKLVNFKNQPLKQKKVEFSNRLNESLEKLITDDEGRLFVMISPGIYKIDPEDYTHRTVRINELGLGYFKIKY